MKGIIMRPWEVSAILENQKTIFRRPIKPQFRVPHYDGKLQDSGEDLKDGIVLHVFIVENRNGRVEQIVPPYQLDQILYVREVFCSFDTDHVIDGVKYVYKANATSESERARKDFGYEWQPAAQMPYEAARIFLRVKDIRIERLHSLFFESDAAIFALREEGFDIGEQCRECIASYGCPCCIDEEGECGVLDDVLSEFADLLDSTIKPADRALYGWAANPWVYVTEFERITREEAENGN